MPAEPRSAHPIQTLRDHATALEAAITVALADAKPKPVHRLRTSTRRIEAQLALLDLLPDLPDHTGPEREVRRLLRKLRRAAGTVRDLDVQRDLLQDLAQQPKNGATAPAPPNSEAPEPARIAKHARKLRRILKHKRKLEADHLVRSLHKLQAKLAPALEDLLDTLAPAESLDLSPADLSRLTLSWYARNTPEPRPGTDPADPDLLHTIRKSAKAARYMAEAAPPATSAEVRQRGSSGSATPAPAALALNFESIQLAGGTWHDLLTLADLSREHLGKRSPLTSSLGASRDLALAEYQRHLQQPPS